MALPSDNRVLFDLGWVQHQVPGLQVLTGTKAFDRRFDQVVNVAAHGVAYFIERQVVQVSTEGVFDLDADGLDAQPGKADEGGDRPGSPVEAANKVKAKIIRGPSLSLQMNMDNGIISRPSRYPASETISRLKKVLEAKNIAVFAQIDQSAEAQKVGLSLRPIELLIFGNPSGGTPLMASAPLSALDLPLKALAWEDQQGQVWLSYNAPAYLQRRFDLSDELIENIAGIGTLIEQALV